MECPCGAEQGLELLCNTEQGSSCPFERPWGTERGLEQHEAEAHRERVHRAARGLHADRRLPSSELLHSAHSQLAAFDDGNGRGRLLVARLGAHVAQEGRGGARRARRGLPTSTAV